jgi:hypothetical protein
MEISPDTLLTGRCAVDVLAGIFSGRYPDFLWSDSSGSENYAPVALLLRCTLAARFGGKKTNFIFSPPEQAP